MRSSSSVSFRVVLGKGHSSRQLPTSLLCLLRVQNCQELDPCFPLLHQSINVMPYSTRLQSHAWNIPAGVGTIGLGAAFLSLCPPPPPLGAWSLTHTGSFDGLLHCRSISMIWWIKSHLTHDGQFRLQSYLVARCPTSSFH